MADAAGVERMVSCPMMREETPFPAAILMIFWTASGDYDTTMGG